MNHCDVTVLVVFSTTAMEQVGETREDLMQCCNMFMVMKLQVVTVYLNGLQRDVRTVWMIQMRASFDLSKCRDNCKCS
jgi:hypothetical protein